MDLFKRVVIGPIALFCIGLTIQVAIIDTKFPISRKLDIWVKDWIRIDHSDSEKISSRIVFISFLFFFCIIPLMCYTIFGNRFLHIPIVCCKSFTSEHLFRINN